MKSKSMDGYSKLIFSAELLLKVGRRGIEKGGGMRGILLFNLGCPSDRPFSCR